MYIKIKNKKLEIYDCLTFSERFKSLKFVLDKIDYGIRIPKKKLISTYFFCQKVDICVTDKNNKIIGIFEDVKTEKRKYMRKSYYIYYLPLGTCKYLEDEEYLIPKEK